MLARSLRDEGWEWLKCSRSPRPGPFVDFDRKAALAQARHYFDLARKVAAQLANIKEE